jgi:ADP-dependent phosphofructokinase/glucokinase
MSSTNYFIVSSNLGMSVNSNDSYEYYLIKNLTANIDIDLISGYNGLTYEFFRNDTNNYTVTLNAATGQTINGNASITIPINYYVYMIYIADDSNWITKRFSTV